ncbi:MAG: acetylxylan esterase [Bryobacteraceae bacterium]
MQRRCFLRGAGAVPVLGGAAPPQLTEQETTAWRGTQEGRNQLRDFLVRTGSFITERACDEIRSQSSWEKLRTARLLELREMLGLLPWPKKTPLNPIITEVVDKGAYAVEKIAFESLPKVYVTANLYVPKGQAGRLPAVVYVCGHAFSPYGSKVKYQRHGISFARNGYVAIILDPIEVAETFAVHYGVYYREMYDWYARGYTPAGVEVWNAIRALDYLETRPEVDAARFGITGRSGGAMMSWFTGAVEPRIRAVVPVMGISTCAANLRDNTQRFHCDCMFAINSYQHDPIHLGALIAPRPLLMAHGKKDLGFPMDGYKEFERNISALYTGYGHPERFRNIEVDTDHADSGYLRGQAVHWFDRYLKGIEPRKLLMEYSEEADASLAVFQGKPPADARNFRIHEWFAGTPKLSRLTNLRLWESRRRELLDLLHTKVFRDISGEPAEPRIERTSAGQFFQELDVVTGDGITVHMLLAKPSKPVSQAPGLIYVASDEEDPAAIHQTFRGINLRDAAIRLVVYPRGVGEVGWKKSVWKEFFRNAMLVGRTVDSMRVSDVLASLSVLRRQEGVDPARITVCGKGVSGILGLYAAVLNTSIHQVMLMDPTTSHAQGPIFLHILRYSDLPEIAALLAPRRLNFYARVPREYEYTKNIYSLYGKPDHVFLAMNIEAVMEGRYDHNFAALI